MRLRVSLPGIRPCDHFRFVGCITPCRPLPITLFTESNAAVACAAPAPATAIVSRPAAVVYAQEGEEFDLDMWFEETDAQVHHCLLQCHVHDMSHRFTLTLTLTLKKKNAFQTALLRPRLGTQVDAKRRHG